MPTLTATLMHGKRDAEGTYSFDVSDTTAADTPVRIMRAFMEHIQATANVGHIDYEINAAMKNRDKQITTVIGEMVFEAGNREPFTCFIALAP
ncbi:MAG: hypothetical protein AAFR47_08720 [Pseudomonadota bacterium]